MVKEIKWSPKAVEQYKAVIDYYIDNISEKSAEHWTNTFWDKIEFISKYPETSRKSDKDKSVHFINFATNYRIYYRLHSGNSLRILSIFDTRQNPIKRPF